MTDDDFDTGVFDTGVFERGIAQLLPDTRRALLHRLATAQAEGRAPSVAAAVVRDGRTVWRGCRGTLDTEPARRPAPPHEVPPHEATPYQDVQYRVGSLTKTLTAVLVLRLRDEGLVDLGDPLGKHLDTPHGDDATLAHLLAHAAGLPAEARGPWWERTPGELRPELSDLFPAPPQSVRKHPTGRRHHYSNPGYALLGALVAKVRGRPWYDVLREEVLTPLGMRRTTALPQPPYATGWAVHPYADVRQPEPAVDTGRMAPAGQLWSTVADLATLAAFLTAGDGRVLAADTVAEMRAPAVAPEPADWTAGYGLGLQLLRRNGRLLAGHAGSMPGFVAGLWTSPDEGLAAVAVANATSGPAVTLAADLLELVAEREPAIPAPWRPEPAADPSLVALTGAWYWGTLPYLLRLHAGRVLSLCPTAGPGRAARFRPEPDGTWTGLAGYFAGETLRVGRRPDGGASHLDVGTFVFTRVPYDPDAPVPGGGAPAGWRG